MHRNGLYVVRSIDDGPPEETYEELEYDFGENVFRTKQAAKNAAERLFRRGGYKIWRMPLSVSWTCDWEFVYQKRLKKTG